MKAGSEPGFTLIELLAVILILGILTTLLITQLGSSEEAALGGATELELEEIAGAIGDYFNEFGDYPPSSFRAEQGVANDGTNVGGEALVVALWSQHWEAGGHLGDLADRFVNVDGDRASSTLTDLASRDLFELPDKWENPIAYLHRRDYEGPGQLYVTIDPATGEELHSTFKAVRNEATGRFYQHNTFQLASAGPDGAFGTEDDITNFEH